MPAMFMERRIDDEAQSVTRNGGMLTEQLTGNGALLPVVSYARQSDAGQICAAEIRPHQPGLAQIRVTQVNITQIDVSMVSAA